MTRGSTVGSVGLVARHLRSRASTSIALAVLVGLAVAVTALLPRGILVLSDAELQQQLAALPPGVTDLYGVGDLGPLDTTGNPPTAESIFGASDAVLRGVPSGLEEPLRDALGDVSWVAILPPDLVKIAEPRNRVQPVLALAVDLHWQDRVTLVAGDVPGPWAGTADAPLQIAISQDYAEQAGFQIGDIVESSDAPLLVTGVYTANDPDDPYWVHARELLGASLSRSPGSPIAVRGAAFVDPASTAGLPTSLERAELRAWYPLLAETMTFAEAPGLTDQLRRLQTLGLYLPSGEALVFETGIPAALDRVTATVATATALLALAGSAPLGAFFAVLALGTGAVIERRRPTLQLATARGASPLQVRLTMLVEGLLVSIPVSAAALAAVTALVPAPVDPGTYLLPALLAVAVPVLFALGNPRSTGGRADLGALPRRGRLIVELAVTGVAAVAVFLLLRRGLVLTGAGGVDPLLAATPLLLGLVVCIIVLRLYPLPLLAFQRAARAGRSPVALVGATGSIRAASAAFGSVLATVLGVSAAILSLVLASTVSSGLGTAAAKETGADIRVDAATLDDLDAVAAIPGVRTVAPLDIVPTVEIVFGLDTPNVTVVFADLEALHAVRPDIPVVPAGSILVSADIAERALGDTELNGYAVTAVGAIPTLALPGVSRSWVLADVADEPAILGEEPSYTSLLIATEPGADIAATAREVETLVTDAQRSVDRDRVSVTGTATLVAEAAARPTVAGLTAALLVAAGLALALCAIAVALGALGAANDRARTHGVLRLLGMSPAQLRGVLAWELAPVTITALAAGTAFGIGGAVVIVNLVDLRALIGGTAMISADVPWLLIAAAVLAFAAVVAGTGALASAAARRLGASAAVKMGVE